VTWQPAAFVDGGPINGVLLRRQYQSTTGGAEGVVDIGDLAVRPLDVPGPGFIVGDGACGIRGRSTAWDGTYYGLNIGDTVVDNVTGTGSGGGRADMVVARVSTGAVVDTHIIQGVPATARTVAETPEPNLSAIPLARIDWPASTGTITAGMITDLRTLIAPRRERQLRIQRGVEPIDLGGNITDSYENWPNLVWEDVDIPPWATQVQMVGHFGNVFFGSEDLAAGTGSTDARGRVRLALGFGEGGGPTDIQSASAAYNFNLNTANAERVSMMVADQRPVPAEMRGATANLRMQLQGTEGVRGRLRADGWSNFYVDLEFLETPVADVDA
jgi:hypothetical protein